MEWKEEEKGSHGKCKRHQISGTPWPFLSGRVQRGLEMGRLSLLTNFGLFSSFLFSLLLVRADAQTCAGYDCLKVK